MNATLTKRERTDRIIYWTATGILGLFLLSGAFFMNSQMAIDSMHHLGIPEWFRWEVSIGHIIGGILLLVPIKGRIKEWNYVALGIDCLSAMIAYLSVDGATANSFSPLINFGILVVSYIFYHRIKKG